MHVLSNSCQCSKCWNGPFLAWQLHPLSHLVEARGEKVHGCQNPTIWAQAILLHDIFVIDLQGHKFLAHFKTSSTAIAGCGIANRKTSYRVSDVNVGLIRNFKDCRVKIENVAGNVLAVKVVCEALQQGCFTRASHTWHGQSAVTGSALRPE